MLQKHHKYLFGLKFTKIMQILSGKSGFSRTYSSMHDSKRSQMTIKYLKM